MIHMIKLRKQILLFASLAMVGFGCSSDSGSSESAASKTTATEAPSENGVGPVKHVDISAEIDQSLADQGKAIFESKCTACHKFEERYVGPALDGVTERRNPAWIMNMITNPEEMTKKDPTAKKLLAEYMTQMVNQNVNEQDSRAILEYLRLVDKN
jgi:mono/diheme cytochrome c family protein